MPQTPSQRRASDAVAAWLSANFKNNAWLVDATNADPGTIGDFLNGNRWPKIGTQGKIEDALGWPAGTIRQIGNGGAVPDGLIATAPSVGGGGDDPEPEEDTLLYRRPEGFTDQEWDRIRHAARGFIEWQIAQAAEER